MLFIIDITACNYIVDVRLSTSLRMHTYVQIASRDYKCTKITPNPLSRCYFQRWLLKPGILITFVWLFEHHCMVAKNVVLEVTQLIAVLLWSVSCFVVNRVSSRGGETFGGMYRCEHRRTTPQSSSTSAADGAGGCPRDRRRETASCSDTARPH